MTAQQELSLRKTALAVRRNVLRQIKAGGSGHVGGALSAVDMLVVLYFRSLNIDPDNPDWSERDRFVLSAGHKCLALYAALAERGFFDAAILDTYGSLGSRLPGHPDMHKIPGVESNTGALGHGLAIAAGMAMGLRMDGLPCRVFVLLGDGELAEGSNWEAAAAAAHHGLHNLLAFVDRNTLQIGGKTTDVMSYEPLDDRWRAFGWSVREIDGHDMHQIAGSVEDSPFEQGKPSLVIANTVKGKGLTFAENEVGFHHWKATAGQVQAAERELDDLARRLEA